MHDNDQTRLPDEGPKSSLLSAGQSFGQYKVIRLLGRGGMGEVYEVENPVLEKRYALKLLNKEIMSRPDAAERFKREAKVMARMDHPNIVKVDDFGEIDGHAVLRMELVEGGFFNQSEGVYGECTSLADLLTGEPLPEGVVVDFLKQILEGLSYAHEQGVVHRDLKPSNILLQPTNVTPYSLQPKICDFGLVRLAGEQWPQSQVQLTVERDMADSDATRLESGLSAGTSTQAMLGTFEFMAPEQKKGQEATEQSDLYSVGLVAFRMLTGEETLGMRRPSEIVDGLNPGWDAWILKALEAKSGQRYENAEIMRLALPGGSAVEPPKKKQAASASSAPFLGSGDQTKVGTSKHSGLKVVLVVLVILCGLAGAFLYLRPTVPLQNEKVPESQNVQVDDAIISADLDGNESAGDLSTKDFEESGSELTPEQLENSMKNSRERFADEYADFREFISGSSVTEAERIAAWQTICREWNVDDVVEGLPDVLEWDDEHQRVRSRFVLSEFDFSDGDSSGNINKLLRQGFKFTNEEKEAFQSLIGLIADNSSSAISQLESQIRPGSNIVFWLTLSKLYKDRGEHEKYLKFLQQSIELDIENSIKKRDRYGGYGEFDESVPNELNEVDKPPQPIERVVFAYPSAAKRKNIIGTVKVEYIVNKNGRVEDIRILESPDTILSEATIEALSRAKFEPARKDQVPVKVIMRASIPYR